MLKKQILFCISGTILEWYDFSLFASLAPLISKIFFPNAESSTAILWTFAVFASGFIMRPIGAIFFGHIGDRWGRKSSLIFTIALMAVSTTLMGLLPTQGGIIFILVLIVLRLIQGFAASGEYAGTIILLYEISSIRHKGFICSLGLLASAMGILLGTIVCTFTMKQLTSDQMLAWGWRIPFLLGFPLAVLVCVSRKYLIESAVFNRAKSHGKLAAIPLWIALKNHTKNLVLIAAMYMLGNVAFYINLVYLNTYTVNVQQLSLTDSFYLSCIVTFVYAISTPIFGYISDYVDRKWIMMLACALMVIFAVPLFDYILSGQPMSQFIGQGILALLLGMFSGPLSLMAAEILPVNVRYSGLAVGLNIGAAIFGGTTPLVCAWLTDATHLAVAPAYYFIVIATIALLSLIYLAPFNHRNKTTELNIELA